MRGEGVVPSASRSARAASVDRNSSSRRDSLLAGPETGSQMNAVSAPPPASTGSSHSLKAALVLAPTNQRAVCGPPSWRTTAPHGDHAAAPPESPAADAPSAAHPSHWPDAWSRRSHARRWSWKK